MLDISHFSHGWISPLLAYVMSFLGCLLGLQCAARARNPENGRVAWLIAAAIAIGGTGIWVMHFIAMLGFSIHGAEIRYDVPLTLFSAVTAIAVVGLGLFLVNRRTPTATDLVAGGTITGLGVGAMHYTGMYAMKSTAVIGYDLRLVAVSLVIAVVASIVALWFTLAVKGFPARVGAALIMGVAVCGMHYTGMAAMHAHPAHHVTAPPQGAQALQLLGPLIGVTSMVTMLMLISVSLSDIGQDDTWRRPRPGRGPGAGPADRGALRPTRR
ncbi:MHYT domain-containing protein [Nocardia thailandica]